MHLSRLIPARLREGAGLLRSRDFRNVFIAQSVSVFGDGITPVALTFAVLDLTGSGTDLGSCSPPRASRSSCWRWSAACGPTGCRGQRS